MTNRCLIAVNLRMTPETNPVNNWRRLIEIDITMEPVEVRMNSRIKAFLVVNNKIISFRYVDKCSPFSC